MTVISPMHARMILLATSTMLSPLAANAQNAAVTLPTIEIEADAPDPASTRDSYLDETPKSATKTSTPVLETPQSISTVTRRQLDDQNPQSVKDALNYTAGVLSTPDTTNRYDSLFMRGYGGFGTSTRIVDFLDGLRLPRGQGFALPSIDPFLLDHLDVLKGPSAVMYGQTSPGGMVNQVSRTPDDVSYNEARLEYGSHNRIQAGLTSQGALDDAGEWQYSLTGITRRAETRYDDVDEERIAIAPALTWQPTQNTSITVQTYYQEDPEGGYFNSIYPKFLASGQYSGALDRDFNVGDPGYESYDREQYGIGYDFDHRINDVVSISSATRYSAMDLDFQGIQMTGALTAGGSLPRQATRSIENVDGISSDNNAQFEFATGALEHTTLVGLDFQRSVSEWEYQVGTAPSLSVTNPQYSLAYGPFTTFIDNRQTLQQTGLYLQDQLALGGWHALLGVRYDWTDQKTENRLTNSTRNQSSDSESYRAGLLYEFDNGIAPYISYSTSFEPTVGVDAASNPFTPTEAEQWEAGVKFEPHGLDALFTVSTFHIVQENVLTADPVNTNFQVQEGEIRSRGIEFEARGQVTENLELIAATTLIDTEVTQSTTASNIGKRPQAAPEYYGSAWANYRFDNGILDGLAVGGGLRFVGSSFADSNNTTKADGYVLADAALSYALGGISPALDGAEATLNVTNLFDKEYYSSCSSNFYCQYGNGAQFLLGLRYKW
ncbi:TonB-dependent siderophore receptor [Thalassospira permensis]|nr:TonB-dependent siderophore receptor [Thalassospira permensis]